VELRRYFRVRRIFLLATAVQTITAAFGVSIFLNSTPAIAAQSVPYKINFQGRLSDNSGNALTDGLYNVKFRLWTLSAGGSNQWEGDRVFGASDNRVQVTNGLFNIQFGDTTLGDPALSPSLFNTGSGTLYLEVELPTPATATCASNGCASFTEGAMTPRQPLASSPYAFNSDTLDGLDSSAFAQLSAANTLTDTNTFSKTGAAGIVLSGTPASAGSLLQIGSAISGGSAGGTLLGANGSFSGDLLNLQVSNVPQLRLDNAGNLTIAGTLIVDTVQAAGGTLSLDTAGAGTVSVGGANAATINVGANAAAHTIHIGDGAAAQTVSVGSTSGASALTLSGGSGNVLVNATGGSVTLQTTTSGAINLRPVSADGVNIILGTSDNVGTLLVLDTKTGAGDPTGVNGGLYYNSSDNKFRCYENSAWSNCLSATLRVTADVSNSTTSFADVTGLTIGVNAGETYAFSCFMTYTTAVSTTALELSVNGPATPTALDYSVLTATSATAIHDSSQTAYDTATDPVNGGGATRLSAQITGTIIPSASGTFAIRSRSTVAASAATVTRGSYCIVR